MTIYNIFVIYIYMTPTFCTVNVFVFPAKTSKLSSTNPSTLLATSDLETVRLEFANLHDLRSDGGGQNFVTPKKSLKRLGSKTPPSEATAESTGAKGVSLPPDWAKNKTMLAVLSQLKGKGKGKGKKGHVSKGKGTEGNLALTDAQKPKRTKKVDEEEAPEEPDMTEEPVPSKTSRKKDKTVPAQKSKQTQDNTKNGTNDKEEAPEEPEEIEEQVDPKTKKKKEPPRKPEETKEISKTKQSKKDKEGKANETKEEKPRRSKKSQLPEEPEDLPEPAASKSKRKDTNTNKDGTAEDPEEPARTPGSHKKKKKKVPTPEDAPEDPSYPSSPTERRKLKAMGAEQACVGEMDFMTQTRLVDLKCVIKTKRIRPSTRHKPPAAKQQRQQTLSDTWGQVEKETDKESVEDQKNRSGPNKESKEGGEFCFPNTSRKYQIGYDVSIIF